MMTTISPFLAFYIRHAQAVDELVELRDHGQLKNLQQADRALFDEVMRKAVRDATALLDSCLDAGAAVFASSIIPGERSDQAWTEKNWDVYWFFQHKRVRGRKGNTVFGVNIQRDRAGLVFLLPYLLIYQATQAQIDAWGEVFARVGVNAAQFDGEDWYNSIILSAVPISADSNPDDLVKACAAAFRRVEPHLVAFAKLDKLAG
jgi:hypothetical protein